MELVCVRVGWCNDNVLMSDYESTSLNLYIVQSSNDTDARPALHFESVEILDAFQVGSTVGASLLSSLFAGWEC